MSSSVFASISVRWQAGTPLHGFLLAVQPEIIASDKTGRCHTSSSPCVRESAHTLPLAHTHPQTQTHTQIGRAHV